MHETFLVFHLQNSINGCSPVTPALRRWCQEDQSSRPTSGAQSLRPRWATKEPGDRRRGNPTPLPGPWPTCSSPRSASRPTGLCQSNREPNSNGRRPSGTALQRGPPGKTVQLPTGSTHCRHWENRAQIVHWGHVSWAHHTQGFQG